LGGIAHLSKMAEELLEEIGNLKSEVSYLTLA
jgi:hypothetical protein